jgi:hypothetical protein
MSLPSGLYGQWQFGELRVSSEQLPAGDDGMRARRWRSLVLSERGLRYLECGDDVHGPGHVRERILLPTTEFSESYF